MNENPYQSPSIEPRAVGVKSGTREDLRAVATYQRGILVCILIYLIAFAGRLVIPAGFQPLVGLGILAVGVVGTVYVFLLAIKVYRVGVGILLGILALIPCVSLLVLAAVNKKATDILKENGIKVGLLGADVSQI